MVDADGHMLGIITVDDVLEFAEKQATEEIQKLGGSEALDAPYFDVGFWPMVKKRGGWLAALFLGEMLTATAMGYFEDEIEKAAVVALFVPLIISSGGNTGSQATSIIIRSLALQEVKLRDWWRVFGRELRTGLALGVFLGVDRLPAHQRLAGAVARAARRGVLPDARLGRRAEDSRRHEAGRRPTPNCWRRCQRAGLHAARRDAHQQRDRSSLQPTVLPADVKTIVEVDGAADRVRPALVAGRADGLLRADRRGDVGLAGGVDAAVHPAPLGFDPATRSAPFVATLVDVTGLIIYFTWPR